ncbi:unannotated protein [freshwater metagenome]|uniref:Unannotated protein n=1 Tax=freshwater metagenome TaxID=449393 RepID=A0A6J7DUD8_9ZZZZ
MTLFIRFQVLLLSALSAHELAGGSLIQTPNFLWEGLGIGVALFCIRGIKLEGPTLALLILFIQSTSHFLLGGGSYQSESRMSLAHLFSGVISYLVISYFEFAREFISSAFVARVPARLFLILSFPELIRYTNTGSNSIFQIRQLTSFLKFRGPPLKWIFI